MRVRAVQRAHESAARRKDGMLTTGGMARLSNSTLRTVRFYEEAGLLQPVQRTGGGHRLYGDAELRKLQLVADLRAAGYSLEDIRQLLETKQCCETGAEAARRIVAGLDAKVASLKEHVALLARLVRELESASRFIRQCTECPTNQRFPDSCDHCEVISGARTIPSAATVLWEISEHDG